MSDAVSSFFTRNLFARFATKLAVLILLACICGSASLYAQTPWATATPGTVTFGTQTVGTASGTQTVKLTSNGTGTLSIAGLTVIGEFTETNNCPATLPVGATCRVNVTFVPAGTVTRQGYLKFNDNVSNSPQVVSLVGTGSTTTQQPSGVPWASAAPGTVTFGTQNVGTTSGTLTVTLTSNGTAPLSLSSIVPIGDFTETNNCPSTLAVGAACTVNVAFAPTATGTRQGYLKFNDNVSNSPQVVSLAGTGSTGTQQPPPQQPPPSGGTPWATATPGTVTFGTQGVGTASSAQTVTLTSNGTGALSLSGIVPIGDFTETNNCPATLAVGATCSVSVTFAPTATGTRQGYLKFNDNVSNGSQVVSLVGTGSSTPSQPSGTPWATASTAALTFGLQSVGTRSGTQTVTLTSNGTATLSLSSVAVTGDFSQTNNCPATLAAGATCTVSVAFAPTATGTRTGMLMFTDNASSSPQDVSLSGSATAGSGGVGTLTSSATSLAFGSVVVGSSSQLGVTFTNSGSANVAISNVSVNGAGFTGSGISTGQILTPGQQATLTVTFAPASSGSVTGASVTVASNASNSPSTVPLTGTGASNSGHSVTLSWNGSGGAIGYDVYRASSASGPFTTPLNSSVITSTQYVDTSVVSGQTYYYVATAVLPSDGQSGYSNMAKATIP